MEQPQRDEKEPAAEAHRHLVYGRTREGEDSLLPGYMSRPNPSPKSRLLEPSSKVSPVTGPCRTASLPMNAGRASRRLRFDTAEQQGRAPVASSSTIPGAAADVSGGHRAASEQQRGRGGVCCPQTLAFGLQMHGSMNLWPSTAQEPPLFV